MSPGPHLSRALVAAAASTAQGLTQSWLVCPQGRAPGSGRTWPLWGFRWGLGFLICRTRV